MSAGFWLKLKGNHTLQSKEQNTIQSYATMRASNGLEGPPVTQTDLLRAESSTRGTRARISTSRPKGKADRSKHRSADSPWALAPLIFDVAALHWFTMSVSSERVAELSQEGGSPL